MAWAPLHRASPSSPCGRVGLPHSTVWLPRTSVSGAREADNSHIFLWTQILGFQYQFTTFYLSGSYRLSPSFQRVEIDSTFLWAEQTLKENVGEAILLGLFMENSPTVHRPQGTLCGASWRPFSSQLHQRERPTGCQSKAYTYKPGDSKSCSALTPNEPEDTR